ncbi:GDP-mannose 4,6-dehydratase [Cryobacterium sp. TMS1-13-1]|uniref:GDP-mannose 4,6-dehydratase n=1 Tax=Cryobacterium sp. TMS1-13-1 TaxID=1259220 RepID=UPI0018E0C241|nr:GDP-mannose 4,6-dehydratase [Cryobacterium sp. TMS1-13-1]
MPRALVTGITGQDGSYLVERLQALGWEVHALVRADDLSRPQSGLLSVCTHVGDLADLDFLDRLVIESEPDVIFNLGGISSVAYSWANPVATGQISGLAAVALLEAAWRFQESAGREVRFVQASSSEIFGDSQEVPQTERTPFSPISPYGLAKTYAHQAVAIFRARGMHASSGILYNHESPRRPPTFVTRKITMAAAALASGSSEKLLLGNLDLKRDWGWAPDYVDALLLMSNATVADDYVIATGQSHSIRDFVTAAFAAIDIEDWERFVGIDQRFVRPADPHEMRGDASKIRSALGWKPTVNFAELVSRMARHDLELLSG